MPNKEEIIFSDFSGGQDIRQFPPSYVQERVVQGKLPHILGVTVRKDGTLRWLRNQYTIDGPSGVTPEALFEYTTSSKEQLLVFGTDGKLHSLETDWASAPTQFEYGYELYNGGSWTERATGQQVTGPWGLVQHRDKVFVCHRSQATKCYAGASELLEVGLRPPETAPGISTTDEDLQVDYTETGAPDYTVLASEKATFTLMPNDCDSRVSKDHGAAHFKDFIHDFQFKITAAAGTVPQVILWALADTADETWVNWGQCVAVSVIEISGVLKLWLRRDLSGGPTSAALSLDTDYYCTVQRAGTILTLRIFSDAGRQTLVDTIEGTCTAEAFQYLYAATALESGAAADTMSGYVTKININEAAAAAGQLPAGTYSYYVTFGKSDTDGNELWESTRGPIRTEVIGADKKIALVSIPTVPSGDTTNWRKIYRAYTSVTTTGAQGTSFGFLVKLDDNTTTTWTDDALEATLGDPIAFDYARPPRGDIICSHKDHLFMAGIAQTSDSYAEQSTTDLQNLLFYSRLNEPYYWPGDNYIEVGNDSPIVGLVSYQDYLIIVKTNSVFLLAGVEGSFVLRQIESQIGATDPCSAASSPQGIAWTTPSGIALYDGQGLRMIYDADSESPFDMPASDYPWLAWHQGYLYFMPSGTTGSRLLRWDSRRDCWEMHYHTKAVDIVGIRAFNFGQYQSHILGYLDCHTATQKIMVLHPAKAFANGDEEGTTWTPFFSRVRITLPPITTKPGEEVWIQRISIDGDWQYVEVGTGINALHASYPVKLYVNTNGDYSTGDLGIAPQNGAYASGETIKHTVLLPPSYTSNTQYIQIAGDYAEDFELRSVNVVISHRKRIAEEAVS